MGPERAGSPPAASPSGPARLVGLDRAPLAMVSEDDQLHVIGPDGRAPRPVTFSAAAGRLWGSAERGGSTWPVWSPDRRWLGCFQVADGGDPTATQVAATEVDGAEERVLLRLDDCLPVHLQWSPDGEQIAVLVQAGEQLQLWVCALSGVPARLIEEGAPLFFSWAEGGGRLLVHAGGAGGVGRVAVRSTTGTGEDEPLTSHAGLFTTPHAAGGSLFWSEADGAGGALVTRATSGGSPRVLLKSRKVLGFLPDPTGRRLALSRAREDGRIYDGLELMMVDSGAHRLLATGPLVAFCWTPDGGALLLCRPLAPLGALRWSLLRAGDPPEAERVIGALRPTRDQLFQLRFFEQFMRSHPPISPDGAALTWAGFPVDPAARPSGRPEVYLADLRGDGGVQALAAGSYAVFPQAVGST